MKFFAITLLVSFAAADGITFQLFDGPSCNQNRFKPDKVVANVNSNSGAGVQSSGCVAATFKSAKFAQFSPGFKCNIYTDSACQLFSQSVTAPDGCDSFPGSSVLCFSQAEFDNPFVDSKVSITVGSKDVGVSSNIVSAVKLAIEVTCTDTGCDPTNKQQFPYRHFNQNGATTVSLTGSYQNTNQRDYMKSLLLSVQRTTIHNEAIDTRGSSENDNKVASQFTFFQVVIRDRNGNIQSEMAATIDTTTQKQNEGDCGIIGKLESAALGALPAVGGLLAKSFDFVCQKAG